MFIKRSFLVVHLITAFTLSLLSQNAGKPIYYYNPQWSPDDKYIVFESTRGGKSAIYTMSANGKNLKKITDTMDSYGQPAWSPDGKSIVYYGSNRPMQLFTNKAAGDGQKLLSTPGLDAYEPNWSTGHLIAFDSRAVGQTPNNIAVMKEDGTGFINITDGSYDCSSPQWSPDGKKILFQRSLAIRKPYREITKEEMAEKKKSGQILTMNADGSDVKILMSDLPSEISPFWSRDGKTIYYLIKKSGAQPVIYSISESQNTSTPLITLTGTVYSASISKTGKYITYAAEREKKHAIYVMDIKKQKEIKIIGD